MSQYFLSFVARNSVGKNEAYLMLLYCVYKSLGANGRYSDRVKDYIGRNWQYLCGKDFLKFSERVRSLLLRRKDLDWSAPSGLRPIMEMRVKDFRGFGSFGKEDQGTHIKFKKRKNIFYAPNGGGKTSLCEALEYGATGHIKESDRRKTKMAKYISRNKSRYYLRLLDESGGEPLKNIKWASCFIDRNRLQEFSLLGSKDSGGGEKDVLAALFGLEELQGFISRFVLPVSFDLSALKMEDGSLEIRRVNERIQDLRVEINHIKEQVSDINLTVCRLLGLLDSDVDAVRLKFRFLKRLLDLKSSRLQASKVLAPPMVLDQSVLWDLERYFDILLRRRHRLGESFAKYSESLNYRAIAEAISSLANVGAAQDVCPACLTPVSTVVVNPFERAVNQLTTLEYLQKLIASREQNSKNLLAAADAIVRIYEGVVGNSRRGLEFQIDISGLGQHVEDYKRQIGEVAAAVNLVVGFLEFSRGNRRDVAIYIDQCSTEVENIKKSIARADVLRDEVARLEVLLGEVNSQGMQKKAVLENMKRFGVQIEGLVEKRRRLLQSAGNELAFNSLLNNITAAYGEFHRDLILFKSELERARVSGVEGKAAEYYRKINCHDEDHERIESLNFSGTGDGGYRINIIDVDGRSLDAFSVLSEGHLRVLGLSLLLSMAEKNKFPIVVFDDVVNAIDSEHRSNIIDLIFSDAYLSGVQMVVTTHDRLFWERFCLMAERNTYSDQNVSYVLKNTNKGVVVIDAPGGFRGKIEQSLSVFDIRQALLYCRIWFESMVVRYCVDSRVEITAHFSGGQLKKNNLLEISLEETFRRVEPFLRGDLSNFNLIKNDLINWGAQNQEHHAFDEYGYNFVHAKTSMEVFNIFKAVGRIECQLFPVKRKEEVVKILADVELNIKRREERVDKLKSAPDHVKRNNLDALERLRGEHAVLQSDLQYIEGWILKMTPPALASAAAPVSPPAELPLELGQPLDKTKGLAVAKPSMSVLPPLPPLPPAS